MAETDDAQTDPSYDMAIDRSDSPDNTDAPLLENADRQSHVNAVESGDRLLWSGRPLAIGTLILLLLSCAQLWLASTFIHAVVHVFPILVINATPGVLFASWYVLEALFGPTRYSAADKVSSSPTVWCEPHWPSICVTLMCNANRLPRLACPALDAKTAGKPELAQLPTCASAWKTVGP